MYLFDYIWYKGHLRFTIRVRCNFRNEKEVMVKNCIATIIPARQVTLAEGASYDIAQSLGGSVTLEMQMVCTGLGMINYIHLGRIEKEVLAEKDVELHNKPFSEDLVTGFITRCYDPKSLSILMILGLSSTLEFLKRNRASGHENDTYCPGVWNGPCNCR